MTPFGILDALCLWILDGWNSGCPVTHHVPKNVLPVFLFADIQVSKTQLYQLAGTLNCRSRYANWPTHHHVARLFRFTYEQWGSTSVNTPDSALFTVILGAWLSDRSLFCPAGQVYWEPSFFGGTKRCRLPSIHPSKLFESPESWLPFASASMVNCMLIVC